MKVLLDNLVVDNYYVCYKFYNMPFYFKYKGRDPDMICSNYYISLNLDNGKSNYYDNIQYFCYIEWYEECAVFQECLITDFLKYLPESNIDKITYCRQKKIEYLLKIK